MIELEYLHMHEGHEVQNNSLFVPSKPTPGLQTLPTDGTIIHELITNNLTQALSSLHAYRMIYSPYSYEMTVR